MKKLGLFLFVFFFFLAGIFHFIFVDNFTTIIPNSLPFKAEIVYITGVIEIILAVGLLLPTTRKVSGKWTAIFLVAVFPANIYSAIEGIPSSINPIFLWVRLAFQPLLIWWVIAVSKNE
ncbi:hypothetical protein GLW08_18315 [Pontibacillus yanchengensis]|uniref:Uncharacterized protein n=2 Tax=Pontibacillus yanchengensis TaxID=462910 RepID=A0ACC7VKP9_9BACI|nr:DoxX family protein [Pontibacillus yanchengensis]MYL35008.1 hypothetical protein [Pontibacillus yanchengensis]MYL55280.1 hypothetical protein [Pontibacillus yanchengensis]